MKCIMCKITINNMYLFCISELYRTDSYKLKISPIPFCIRNKVFTKQATSKSTIIISNISPNNRTFTSQYTITSCFAHNIYF